MRRYENIIDYINILQLNQSIGTHLILPTSNLLVSGSWFMAFKASFQLLSISHGSIPLKIRSSAESNDEYPELPDQHFAGFSPRPKLSTLRCWNGVGLKDLVDVKNM